MDGGHPTIDYMGDVCGTGSFTGYFILSGDARLAAGTEQLVDAGSVSGAWTVDAPTGPVPDVLTNSGAEAFKISLPDMTPCVGSGSAIGSGGASLGGVVFWISGQLSRPIEFSGSVMGLAGPKKTMVWPLLGAFDQFSTAGVLGEYIASGAISDSLSRPPVFTVQVRGDFPEQDEIFSTRPAATSDGTWDQYAPYFRTEVEQAGKLEREQRHRGWASISRDRRQRRRPGAAATYSIGRSRQAPDTR